MMTKKVRPFLKWPGGKFRLLPTICQHLPAGELFVEPFVGSAAIFLNTDYDFSHLNDINPDVINLYKHLQEDGKDIIGQLSHLFKAENNKENKFYHYRDKFNASSCTLERSALFVYLNRHGFNGLCRYNKKGYFNVPFGRYKQPYLPIDEIKCFCSKAKKATFTCTDFKTVLSSVPSNAVVYCDPPYVPLSSSANFTGYSGNEFAWQQQVALADLALQHAQKGGHVLISNHDVKLTRELYAQASLSSFSVPRFISCKSQQRKPAPELLALYSAAAFS